MAAPVGGAAALKDRLLAHLSLLYPTAANSALADQMITIMDLAPDATAPAPYRNLWDETDLAVIAYGNSLQRPGEVPLHTLHRFFNQHLAGLATTAHLLPFYPYSSDDGFAVMDYEAVDTQFGSWAELRALAGDFRLMADLVINHCSARHPWFEQFQRGEAPGKDYFVVPPDDVDLSNVVRPRTSPLLRPTDTPTGQRPVWCTFSHDQVDLNFANPAVLLEFVRILRFYLDQGVRMFRLDAVAFLWKDVDSNCLNLPQTHEIVRLLRTLLEHRAADAILITETNIPNQENLSYFGNANEAHLIYNFSLPPLLLNSLVTGDCRHLKTWMMSMPPAQNGTTFFNFIASHDGIGLRPAEGLLDEDELALLIRTMERFGGHISWRSLNAVDRRPYEINIALFDALKGTVEGEDHFQIERFICAHAIMLALEGLPAFYLHSLLATPNDQARYRQTGAPRALNRHQWDADNLAAQLADEGSTQHQVLHALSDLIRIRRRQPAFHPNATQFTLHLGNAIFGFWRQSLDRRQSIFALHNVSRSSQRLALTHINLVETDRWVDLISGEALSAGQTELLLAPYQCVWLSNRST